MFTNLNLGPYRYVESCGTMVKVYSLKDYRPVAVPMPKDHTKCIVVRFVRGGKMYAGLAPRKHAPVRRDHAHTPAPTPTTVRGLLGNLTAIEAANRTRALHAARQAA